MKMRLEKIIDKKKKELDSFRPFPVELELNLENWFCVEATYHSNAIEGNSLTKLETAMIIEKGITGSSKLLVEYLEAKNHAEAFEWIMASSKDTEFKITETVILRIQELILKNIDDTNAGKYRKVSVRVRNSQATFPNPAKIPALMKEFIEWLDNANNLHPVELAALAHYKLVTIHPFVDGNGRTSRLLMNLLLGLHGFPPAVVEVEKRKTYFDSLQKAQTQGSLEDFQELIYSSVEQSLDIYLEALRDLHKFKEI